MNYDIQSASAVLHTLAAVYTKAIYYFTSYSFASPLLNALLNMFLLKAHQLARSLVSQQSHLNPQPMGTCTGVCKTTLIRL